MKIRDITTILEQAAPLGLQADFDNSGLLVGDADAEINGALLCVDITEAVLDEAIELGAGLIVSHHPVIFRPLKRLTDSSHVERVVAKAVRHNIALYACHTNLDSAADGLSHRLGKVLGLKNTALLQPSESGMFGTGYGITGEPHEAMPTVEYLRYVKRILGLKVIRHSDITHPTVGRVALCTGSGASMTSDAKRAGADLYISADFKYNDFPDADRELVIADIGHFESEYYAIDLMYDIIKKKISTFALHKSKRSVNPINYLTD